MKEIVPPENQGEKVGVEKFTEKEMPVALKERLSKLRTHEDDNIFSKVNDKIGNFGKRLKEEYGDFEDYLLYHLLAGSSLRGACEKYDFPGEDSVEKFIDDLYKKYIEKAEAEDLKERVGALYRKDRMGTHEKIAIFGNSLRGKYGKDEVRKCVMFHVLIGSSGYDDIVKFFDFPGDDSIEKFIESLEEEQGGGEDEK